MTNSPMPLVYKSILKILEDKSPLSLLDIENHSTLKQYSLTPKGVQHVLKVLLNKGLARIDKINNEFQYSRTELKE